MDFGLEIATVHAIDGQAWFWCVPQVVLLRIETLHMRRSIRPSYHVLSNDLLHVPYIA
ncbi:MAG TPA: hypothetical protein PKD54_05735 [Pirellulaceae bacterium]|nr:hypothetical protein [Pirellulaceae bacterium]